MARRHGLLLLLAALSAMASLSGATKLGRKAAAAQGAGVVQQGAASAAYKLPPGVEVHALIFYGRRATFKLLNCELPAAHRGAACSWSARRSILAHPTAAAAWHAPGMITQAIWSATWSVMAASCPTCASL